MTSQLEFARRQMINQQVRAWDVLDPRVLTGLESVPRERFVPEVYRDVAFADASIPIGHGQHMLPPKIEGRILQALDLGRADRVLEVGTGTGFFAACLAELAGSVDSIEIHAELAEQAAARLAAAGYGRVRVMAGDVFAQALADSYDAIVLTGSLPVYDPRFERALAVGGRLFAVVGTGPTMEARLVTRTAADAWFSQSLFETFVEPLLNSAPATRFIF